MQTSTSNSNQLLLFAAVMFGAIVAAVIVSTIIIMSLMRGELASAMSAQPTVVTAASVPVGSCTEPIHASNSETQMPESHHDASAVLPSSAPHHVKPTAQPVVNNSYNTSSVTTTNTNNTATATTINTNSFNKDSFNTDNSKDSHNVTKNDNDIIVKDNTVAINSGNTTVKDNTVNVNSNNSIENHLLSDNVLNVAPYTLPPLE